MVRDVKRWAACGTVMLAFCAALILTPPVLAETHALNEADMNENAVWAEILETYLRSGDEGQPNLFDYQALAADTEDRGDLELYIAALEGTPVSTLSREEQFAFWVNLYNALTVKVVLDHYPVPSIRKIGISPGLFSVGPWGAKLVTVEGKRLSLDNIEHDILRPGWQDPRIHYAVNCASIGCPNLAPEPYEAATLESQLDEAARDYINSPRGIDVRGSRVRASKIYDWYGEDFGDSHADILAHVRQYADKDLLAEIEGIDRISSFAYDWALNDVSGDGGN